MLRPKAKNRTTVEAIQTLRVREDMKYKKRLESFNRFKDNHKQKRAEYIHEEAVYSEHLNTTIPEAIRDLARDGKVMATVSELFAIIREYPGLKKIRRTDVSYVLDHGYIKNSKSGWEARETQTITRPATKTIPPKKPKKLSLHDYTNDEIACDPGACYLYNRNLDNKVFRGASSEECFKVIGQPDERTLTKLKDNCYYYEYDHLGIKVVFNDSHNLVRLLHI